MRTRPFLFFLVWAMLISSPGWTQEEAPNIAAVLVAYEDLMMGDDDAGRRAAIAGLAEALSSEIREAWDSAIHPGIEAVMENDPLRARNVFTEAADRDILHPFPALRAFALRLAGRASNAVGRHQEALETFRLVTEALGKDVGPAIAHQAALAENHRAATLAALARNEEEREAAIAAYRSTVETWSASPHKPVRRVAAATLFTMAMLLEEWERHREAAWAFDAFEADFSEYATRDAIQALAREAWQYADLGPGSAPAPPDPVAIAPTRETEMLFMQAQARLNEGAPDEAVAIYDLIIGSHGDEWNHGAAAPTLSVLHAMLGKGRALERAGDVKGAIAAYEALFDLHGGGETEADRLAVLAMTACGTVHGRLGDDRAALDAFSRMLTLYESSHDHIIMEQVASVLMLSAKIAYDLNDTDEAKRYLDRLDAWSASRPMWPNPHRDEAMELRMTIEQEPWLQTE